MWIDIPSKEEVERNQPQLMAKTLRDMAELILKYPTMRKHLADLNPAFESALTLSELKWEAQARAQGIVTNKMKAEMKERGNHE